MGFQVMFCVVFQLINQISLTEVGHMQFATTGVILMSKYKINLTSC